jgi:trk system potassium uptake protein TrkH
LFIVFSGVMLAIGLLSLVLHRRGAELEQHAWSTLWLSAGISLCLGGISWGFTRQERHRLLHREALFVVAMSWLLGAAMAALPYYLWARQHHGERSEHPFESYVNCYFEAMSGLTTTGASILSDVETVPDSLLIWRATTNWLGGLGIILFFVAVLPSFGVGGKRLATVETATLGSNDINPQIRHTARALWLIYAGLTAAGILALRIAGLEWFDAFCSCFAAIATGGFGTQNANIGAFESRIADVIIIVLMVLGGVSFGLYARLLMGRHRDVWRDGELRAYLVLLLVGSVTASIILIGHPIVTTTERTLEAGIGDAIRYGAFNVVSMGTDTGFATADFDLWPFLLKAIIVGMVFVGGCAGSTAGGVKVMRLLIVIRVLITRTRRTFRPELVQPVKVGGHGLDADEQTEAVAYVVLFAIVILVGAVGMMILEPAGSIGFTTASTAALATLCTTGPGLSAVGPTADYGWFTDASKILMSLLMVMGRLELFTILVLFVPGFWKTD